MINTMTPLQPCPCGKQVTDLIIMGAGQGGKYMRVCGDCCGEWEIEFRSNYEDINSDECKQLAIAAWNNAPRGLK